MKFKFFLASPLIVLIVISGVVADEPEMSTTLRSISIGVDLRDVQAGSDSNSDLMRVTQHEVSEPVRYQGPPTVTFYAVQSKLEEFAEFEGFPEDRPTQQEQEGASPPETTEPPEEITTVTLNPEWSDTLLVWMRGSRGQIRAMVVNGDLLDFPLGHTRFVNLTPFRLGIITKDHGRELVQPIEHWTVNAGDSRAIHFHAILNLPDADDDVISDVVSMRPHVRRTAFFVYSAFDESGVVMGRHPFFSFWIYTARE